MTQGIIETKGTRLFFAISASEILKVSCATGISGLGGAASQINSTCLDSDEQEFQAGMAVPGALSIPINFIPRSGAHQALTALKDSGDKVSWMVVFSDQSGDPVSVLSVDAYDRLVSPGPTTAEFIGYVADFNIDIATNEIVRATLTVQRSGPVSYSYPAADLP